MPAKGDDERPPPDRPAGLPGKSDGDGAGRSDSTTVSEGPETQELQELHVDPGGEEEEDTDDADTMEVYLSRVLRGEIDATTISSSTGGGGTSTIASEYFGAHDSRGESYEQVVDRAGEVAHSSLLSQPGAYAVTPILLPRTSLRRSANDDLTSRNHSSRRSSARLSSIESEQLSEFSSTATTAPTADAVVATSEYNDQVYRIVEAVAVSDDVLHAIPMDEVVQEDGRDDDDMEEGGAGNRRRSSDGIASGGNTIGSSSAGPGNHMGKKALSSWNRKCIAITSLVFLVAAIVICTTVLTRNRGGSGSSADSSDVGNANKTVGATPDPPSVPSDSDPNIMELLLAFEAKSLQTCSTKGYPDVCGGCWCVGLSADNNYQCPDMPQGMISGCTTDERRDELAAIYASFIQTGAPDYIKPAPVLQSTGLYVLPPPDGDGVDVSTSNGTHLVGSPEDLDMFGSPRSPCDPFSLGEDTHPESQSRNPFHGLPPCFPQAMEPPYLNPEPDMVCSYKYAATVKNIDECRGREYELRSYPSADQAIADGAEVVHSGPCGFCSSAHDRAALIRIKSVMKIVFRCKAKLATTDPPSLISCIMDVMQISQPCGAWISTSLFMYTSIFCYDECVAGGTPPFLQNGVPPECTLRGCQECRRAQMIETPKLALAGSEPFIEPHNMVLLDEFIPCENRHFQSDGDESKIPLFDPCDGLI